MLEALHNLGAAVGWPWADGFFARALLAGCGVALAAGPLGCFVVWRRLAYFGDALAHSALLGVALAFLLEVPMALAVFAGGAGAAMALLLVQRRAGLSSDAVLGLLAHAALALGLVCLALMPWVQVDLLALLFGDVLAVSAAEVWGIFAAAAAALLVLSKLWRPLVALSLNRELAQAEGMRPARADAAFILLLALLIALAMKVVGVLLITALLIIPAATVRRFAGGPEAMAVMASLAGMAAVVGGLFASLAWDTPAGPSVVCAALLLFLLSLLPRRMRG